MQDVELATALLAALAVGAIAFELRPEAVPFWRLFIAPLPALAAALALPPEPGWRPIAVGLLAGIAAGSLRGCWTPLRVDRIRKVVRLRRAAYDGAAFALAISVLAGVDTKPTAALVREYMVFVPFKTVAFFAAGYLLGRAVTIGLRARAAPHDDMGAGNMRSGAP